MSRLTPPVAWQARQARREAAEMNYPAAEAFESVARAVEVNAGEIERWAVAATARWAGLVAAAQQIDLLAVHFALLFPEGQLTAGSAPGAVVVAAMLCLLASRQRQCLLEQHTSSLARRGQVNPRRPH